MKSRKYENILVYNISHKIWIGAKPFRIRFDKVDGIIRVFYGTRYLILLALKNMIPFVIGLDIL